MTKNAAIEAFVSAIQTKHMTNYYNSPNLTDPIITVEYGKKYAKIIKDQTGQRCVFCFVEIETGNILKAASWKAPAKTARGNINTPTFGVEFVSPYGAAYLR